MEQPKKKWSRLHRRDVIIFGACLVLLCVPGIVLGQDADDDFAKARNLFRDAGDWDTAARKFAEFILNYPGNANLPEARLMLARSYSRSDPPRLEEAVRVYAAFLEHHSGHLSTADARREHAGCLTRLGRYRQAAVALEELQRLFSATTFAPDVLLEAASNYRRSGDFAGAERVYGRVIDEYSTYAAALDARYHLAQLRFAQGDGEAALALLEQIDAASPESDQARNALLMSQRILQAFNRSTRASQVMERLVVGFANSTHADSALVDFARFHFRQDRYGEAVVAYERAAKRKSDTPGWMDHVRLGLADALREAGTFDRAVEVYKQVTSRPEVAPSTSALARVGLATTYSRSGRAREAVPLFLSLIQANNPTVATSLTSRQVWAMAVRELAALYRHQGDYTRSSVWYDKYLSEADRQGADFGERVEQQEWVRLQMAKLYDSAGQSSRAIQLFENLQDASAHLQPDVQRSLGAAFENAGETSRALHEFRVFLERFPDHNYARRVRERIELLSEFTIRDQDTLDRALRQAWIDDLNGRSRRALMFDLALTLRHHQDFENAVRTLETYVASYPDDSDATRAQYLLAECLLSLGRKRQLEGERAQADSLIQLGQEEHRILAARNSPFSHRSQLRLVVVGASGAPDSTRLLVLESGLTALLSDSLNSAVPADDIAIDTRAQALLQLGDTRRQLGVNDGQMLTAAQAAYEQLIELAPDRELVVRARFGRALCLARLGEQGIVDSLQVLLNQQAGRSLVPNILVELGHALIASGESRRAVSRFRELLAAFPAYAGRRAVLEKLADTNLQLKEYHLAIGQYQRLLESEPVPERVFDLRRRLALTYRAAGYSAEALDLYATMLSEDAQTPGADSLAFNRGVLLVELGRLEDGVEAFSTLRRNYPASALATQAHVETADLLFELGHYDRAYEAYSALLKEASPRLVGRATAALFRLNRLEEGRKLGKSIDGDEIWKVLVQLEEGRLYLRSGDHERAQKMFSQVEKKSREKPLELGAFSDRDTDLANMAVAPAAAAAYYLATSKWQQDERDPSEEGLALALEAQRRFLADYGDSPQAVDVHLRIGNFNFKLTRKYLMAAASFRRVLETSSAPRSKRQEAVWMLLRCYMKAYEYADAHETAARLLKEFPDHPKAKEAQLEIGSALIEQGQHAEAIGYFRSVLSWAKGEDAAFARFHIGRAFQNLDEYREAIEAYHDVRYYGADSSAGWITTADFERAGCHVILQQYSIARKIYNEIIRREGSDSDFGKAARKQLEQLEE